MGPYYLYMHLLRYYMISDLNNARLNSTVGSFSSPRYQGPTSLQYPNNLDFTLTIATPADTGLIVTFTEFNTGYVYGGKCMDYVEVCIHLSIFDFSHSHNM